MSHAPTPTATLIIGTFIVFSWHPRTPATKSPESHRPLPTHLKTRPRTGCDGTGGYRVRQPQYRPTKLKKRDWTLPKDVTDVAQPNRCRTAIHNLQRAELRVPIAGHGTAFEISKLTIPAIEWNPTQIEVRRVALGSDSSCTVEWNQFDGSLVQAEPVTTRLSAPCIQVRFLTNWRLVIPFSWSSLTPPSIAMAGHHYHDQKDLVHQPWRWTEFRTGPDSVKSKQVSRTFGATRVILNKIECVVDPPPTTTWHRSTNRRRRAFLHCRV
jgi:hypothetical protein